MKTTLIISCDHAGFADKEQLLKNLTHNDTYEIIDVGPQMLDEDDDYPLMVAPLCKLLLELQSDKKPVFGAIIARSGQGEAIVANRFKGIRAIVVNNPDPTVVTLGRQHNDANVISFGSEFLSLDEISAALELFISTPFSGEDRHERRIALIDDSALYE